MTKLRPHARETFFGQVPQLELLYLLQIMGPTWGLHVEFFLTVPMNRLKTNSPQRTMLVLQLQHNFADAPRRVFIPVIFRPYSKLVGSSDTKFNMPLHPKLCAEFQRAQALRPPTSLRPCLRLRHGLYPGCRLALPIGTLLTPKCRK